MSKQVLLFDFDGVIVDTFEMNLTLSKEVGQRFTREEYKKLFEGNIYAELENHHQRELTQEDNDRWFSRYSPRVLTLEPVPGIVEALKELSSHYTLTVVSSTINSPIEEYLAKHDLMTHFDKVFGSDVDTSKVEKIKMIFKEFETDAESCVFITDTLGDMKEARTAGVDSVAVTWGFHERDTLEKGKPVSIVETPAALVSAVDTFFEK